MSFSRPKKMGCSRCLPVNISWEGGIYESVEENQRKASSHTRAHTHDRPREGRGEGKVGKLWKWREREHFAQPLLFSFPANGDDGKRQITLFSLANVAISLCPHRSSPYHAMATR